MADRKKPDGASYERRVKRALRDARRYVWDAWVRSDEDKKKRAELLMARIDALLEARRG